MSPHISQQYIYQIISKTRNIMLNKTTVQLDGYVLNLSVVTVAVRSNSKT